jgi:hypothetical protein
MVVVRGKAEDMLRLVTAWPNPVELPVDGRAVGGRMLTSFGGADRSLGTNGGGLSDCLAGTGLQWMAP